MQITYPSAVRFIFDEYNDSDEYNHLEVIDTIEGFSHRWDQDMRTILYDSTEDNYWGLDWRKGLTEMQEDNINDLPFSEFEELDATEEQHTIEEYGLVDLVPLVKRVEMIEQVTYEEQKGDNNDEK